MSVMVFSRSRYPAGRSGTTVIVATTMTAAAAGARRLTKKTWTARRLPTSVKNPARENVTITVAMLRISAPAARLRATAPLESASSAPAMGMMRFKVSARSLGFPGESGVAGDPLDAFDTACRGTLPIESAEADDRDAGWNREPGPTRMFGVVAAW